jgi:hypothetical protein
LKSVKHSRCQRDLQILTMFQAHVEMWVGKTSLVMPTSNNDGDPSWGWNSSVNYLLLINFGDLDGIYMYQIYLYSLFC